MLRTLHPKERLEISNELWLIAGGVLRLITELHPSRGYLAGKQGQVPLPLGLLQSVANKPGGGSGSMARSKGGNHTLGAARCHRLSAGDRDTPSPPLPQPCARAARGLLAERTPQGSAAAGAGRRGPAPDPGLGWIWPIPWAPLALYHPTSPARGQTKASASLANGARVHLRTVLGQMPSPKLANSQTPPSSLAQAGFCQGLFSLVLLRSGAMALLSK